MKKKFLMLVMPLILMAALLAVPGQAASFKLTYTRTTETGGTQTITVEGLALH